MNNKKQKITESEMAIMQIIWNTVGPLTSNEILNRLPEKKWKITTLITLAGKLIDKGFVKSVKVGRSHAHHYSALITEQEYKQIETLRFIQDIHKGSTKSLFNALFDVQNLTLEEVNELKEAIKKWGEEGRIL